MADIGLAVPGRGSRDPLEEARASPLRAAGPIMVAPELHSGRCGNGLSRTGHEEFANVVGGSGGVVRS